MTQEWFESADLEKKAPKTTSENQPEETETVEPVDTDIQASEETDISSKEAETHDEEAPETIEENQTEEQGEAKADQDKTQESSAKVKNLINKALESPYIPEIDPHKTARLKEEISLFWSWIVEALKSPTSNLETSSTHSYTAFLLLILFSASSFFFSIYHIKHAYYGHIATINSHFPEQFASLNLFSIISILVATTLFFFSFLLGSFVVRRFIYQEKDWTLEKVLQQYSQLLAIPIFLTAIASFFAFFDSLRFTALLCVISIGIILLASLHIITRPSQASETDSFYQLFLSVLVNGVIILLFFVAEVALIGDYLRILAFL